MVKVISLSEEAYTRLKSIKGDRSFSETVLETLDNTLKRKNIMDFVGIFEKTSSEWEEISKKLDKDRKNFRLREAKL